LRRGRAFQRLLIAAGLLLCLGAAAQDSGAPMAISDVVLRMRYVAEAKDTTFVLRGSSTLRAKGKDLPLAEGSWTARVRDASAARTRFHVFSKTFRPAEEAAREGYLDELRARGYAPEVEIFGKRFQGPGGKVIDNRQLWVSLARFDAMAEAEALRRKLETESIWAWIRPEEIAPGKGTLVLRGSAGKTVEVALPARLVSEANVAFPSVNMGYWKTRNKAYTAPPPLDFSVGSSLELQIMGPIRLETYLRGVLPAEMSASSPGEALEAQAVAARSEVLASMAGKHRMEGFDFCPLEHCRADLGLDGQDARTSAAVKSTTSEILIDAEGRAVAAVFSANCGGWTEHNENVWSGPANPALRAVADGPKGKAPPKPGKGLNAFLKSTGAHCAGTDNHRWTKRMTASELSTLVNKAYPVGAVKSLEVTARGESGRAKALRIKGAKKSVTVQKELEIRRVLGGLPSAVFQATMEGDTGAPKAFVFRGAGRGHGVGLCQDGARGMAARGVGHRDILTHYFAEARVEKLP